jgi:heptose II phosphotransferase
MEIPQKTSWKNYSFWTIDPDVKELLVCVLENRYSVVETYKNSKRNYVARIKINEKDFVLKENLKETHKWNYILKYFHKDSEELQTLKNSATLRKEGFNNAPLYYGVIERRAFGVLRRAVLLEEYVPGQLCLTIHLMDKIIECVKRLHQLGRYHGDCKPTNFIEDDQGLIRCLDSKFKKKGIGKFQTQFDFVNLQYDSYHEMNYPYPKDIWYHIAYAIKRYRKWIQKLKSGGNFEHQ